MFLTTNYVDRMDRRLLRSGRVDRRVHFGYAQPVQVATMIEKFWPDLGQSEIDHLTQMILRKPVVTAQIQEFLLLFQDSWEQAYDHVHEFHTLIDPVCDEQAQAWEATA